VDKNVIIADSIKYQPHIYAFDILMQQTLRRIDVSQALIYFVDTVNAEVLPYLAQEFDVLGIKGWDFAADEDAQRDLIKRAIELHKYKGTPWAVEQVMAQAGLTGAVLEESIGDDPDTGWAVFRVTIDTGVLMPDPAQIANATTLINLYKNARSEFEGILYTNFNFTETTGLTMSEGNLLIDADETLSSDSMSTVGILRADGTVKADGSRNCSQDSDTIFIQII